MSDTPAEICIHQSPPPPHALAGAILIDVPAGGGPLYHNRTSNPGEYQKRGGGGSGIQNVVRKMARQEFPRCNFWFFPTIVTLVWRRGFGTRPRYLFVYGAYWPLATAHSDPLWVRTCFGCVNRAPPDDLSCLTTPEIGGPGDGLLPMPLTRCIQMHTPSPCGDLPTPALTCARWGVHLQDHFPDRGF